MRPLTYTLPKAMVPLNGRPILEHTLRSLPEAIEEIIIVINYLGEQIKEKFGSEFQGKPIRYIAHDALDGTGGAIHACRSALKNSFLVLMGDDLYSRTDLEKLIQEKLAVLVFAVDDPTRFGVITTDSQGNLKEIIEKPQTRENRLANTGGYVLNQDFFNYPLVAISETEFGLPQTLAQMKSSYKIKVVPAAFWQPVGKPEDIPVAEKKINNAVF